MYRALVDGTQLQPVLVEVRLMDMLIYLALALRYVYLSLSTNSIYAVYATLFRAQPLTTCTCTSATKAQNPRDVWT